MKPLSIGRLALLYLVLTGLMMVAMGVYVWREIGQTTRQLQSHENQAARQELAEGMKAVMERMRKVGDALAGWDETKQQLAYPEYYVLWRDNRVRDAGLLPPEVDAVALYDRTGGILLNSNSPDPMPTTLPGKPPMALFKREAGHEQLYLS